MSARFSSVSLLGLTVGLASLAPSTVAWADEPPPQEPAPSGSAAPSPPTAQPPPAPPPAPPPPQGQGYPPPPGYGQGYPPPGYGQGYPPPPGYGYGYPPGSAPPPAYSAAEDPYAGEDEEPEKPRKRKRYSTAMMVTGIVLTPVGFLTGVMGLALTVVENKNETRAGGTALLVAGGLGVIVGIPLIVVGARRPKGPAWASMELGVGPGRLSVQGSF